MNITELKKSLFGYSKESVYRYISYLNQEFSQKLLEKDSVSDNLVKELQERNSALEKEIESLRAENDTYKRMQSCISESIISAKNYENEIKDAAVLEGNRIRKTIEEETQRKEQLLKGYIETVEKYRASLVDILKEFEGVLNNAANEGRSILNEQQSVSSQLEESKEITNTDKISGSSDMSNMSMFRRVDINFKTEASSLEKQAE